jgi:hypothetical protein
VAATAGGAGAAAPDDRHPPAHADPGLQVDVWLTADTGLPPASRAVLTREVDDIWRRQGVCVQWLASLSGRPSDLTLRVLVVRRETSKATEGQWPVGELRLTRGGAALAIASITAAERVLEATTRPEEPMAMRDRRLGLILGRAVAHEMGHYLLDTNGHAGHGLMRARIEAGELSDVRSGGFFLDAPAARWIRDGLGRVTGVPTRLARFDSAR